MRILILINMYPPYSDGGYAMQCEETVTELRRRGHDLLVLTGTRGGGGRRTGTDGVWRIFDYCERNEGNQLSSTRPVDLWYWFRREWVEHALLRKALDEFRPDVIHVWTTWGLSYSIATHLARYPVPFCAYVCGYYIKEHNRGAPGLKQYRFWRWSRKSGLSTWLKAMLRKVLERRIPLDHEPLLFDALAFNTTPIANDHAGMHLSRTPPVRIVDGVPLERFAALDPPDLSRPRKVLFVGRLHPVKDPLTLVQACAALQARDDTSDIELTLVGWRHDLEYAKLLEQAIRAAPSPERIRIEDPVEYAQVPALFARHQILVVPSLVDPLPRTAAEGMAAGLPVVVSRNTGISELIRHGEHALIFRAGDAKELAGRIRDLMFHATLARRLQESGRSHAVECFSTNRMVDEVERFLRRAIERAPAFQWSANQPRAIAR